MFILNCSNAIGKRQAIKVMHMLCVVFVYNNQLRYFLILNLKCDHHNLPKLCVIANS